MANTKTHNLSGFLILSIFGLLAGAVLAVVLVPEDLAISAQGNHPVVPRTGQPGGSNSLSTKPASKEATKANPGDEEGAQLKDPIEVVREAFGDREALNLLPPPDFHPRPGSEWQGMLVDNSMQSICDGESACGLAMACMDNLCGACATDSDCASGESCVLDHCVVSQNVVCRTAADCDEGEYCVLSGYSEDARGNGTMEAYCQASVSGSQPTLEDAIDITVSDPGPYAPERSVSLDRLQEMLSFNGTTPEETPKPTDKAPQRSPAEPFDEQAKESEFEAHENFDETDPQEMHEVVEEKGDEPNI